MERRHQAPAGSKGISRRRGQARGQRRGVEPGLEGGRPGGRSRSDRPSKRRPSEAALARSHRCTSAPDRQEEHELRIGAGLERPSGVGERPAASSVAAADGDRRRPSSGDRAHGHLVLGHGAGLVGADHGGGAERLDGRQPPHERARSARAARGRRPAPPPSPPASPPGSRRPRGVMAVSSIRPTGWPWRMPARPDDRADVPSAKPMSRRPRASTWRSSGVARCAGQGDELTDAPELGRDPRRGHDRAPAAGEHGGAEVDHGASLGQRRLGRKTRASASLSTGTLSPVRAASATRSGCRANEPRVRREPGRPPRAGRRRRARARRRGPDGLAVTTNERMGHGEGAKPRER